MLACVAVSTGSIDKETPCRCALPCHRSRYKCPEEASSPSHDCSCTDSGNWFLIDWPHVAAYTMIGQLKAKMAYEGVKTLAANGVEGDIVELGVWKGGVTMLLALAAARFRNESLPRRHLWAYDTFEGLPEPGIHDDAKARDIYRALANHENTTEVHKRKRMGLISADNKWNVGAIAEVMTNVGSVLNERRAVPTVHFVRGKVEETLLDPRNVPSRIALLRLDTDWYASTRAELAILWPRLAVGGLLIGDDYDNWGGARRATEEFLKEEHIPGPSGVVQHNAAGFRVWKTRA